MATIKTILSKAAALRKAQIDVIAAKNSLRCVPVESILNPYIGKNLRVTKTEDNGQIGILNGELIYVDRGWIQLDLVEWETEHEHLHGEGRYAMVDIEDMINIEIL